MKNRVLAGALVGTMAIGGITAFPLSALAADTSTDTAAEATARTPGQWVTDALKGLVDDGTLTQEQSDKVASTLEEAKPEGGRGGFGHGPGGRIDFSVVAEKLSLTEDELRTEMQAKSIADIAEEKGVDLNTIITTLVDEANAAIDERVADGSLTQEKADELKASTQERVMESVNRVRSERGPRGGFGGETPPVAEAPAAESSSTTSAA